MSHWADATSRRKSGYQCRSASTDPAPPSSHSPGTTGAASVVQTANTATGVGHSYSGVGTVTMLRTAPTYRSAPGSPTT